MRPRSGFHLTSDHKLLAALLLLFAAVKVPVTYTRHHLKMTGLDGGYYFDLALNIRDGLGFVTDISPFHQGLPYMPYPSPVYPLWPLVLGYFGRIVDIEFLAYWLPASLYFITLVLAWTYGKCLFPKARALVLGVEINAGHVLAMLFGMHRYFFFSTSSPYTEGLSYALLMLVLNRTLVIYRELTPIRGLELGIWAGALFLCRSQLLIFAMASGATLLMALPRFGGMRVLKAGAAFLVGFAASFAPEYIFLRGFVTEGVIESYLRFDQFQATSVLPKLQPMVETHGLGHFILDRLKGVRIAFDPASKFGYYQQFYLFPVIFLLSIAGFFIRPKSVRGLVSRIRSDLPFAFLLIFASAGMVSLHSIHLKYWTIWTFAARQGISAAFAFFIAASLALELEGRFKKIVAVLIVASMLIGAHAIVNSYREPLLKNRPPHLHHAKLISWLNQQALNRGQRLIVVVPSGAGKMFASHTPNVAYQEYGPEPSPLEPFFTRLGVRYLIVSDGLLPQELKEDPAGFHMRFKKVPIDVAGSEVFEFRGDAAS